MSKPGSSARDRSFYRKVTYLVAMGALLMPLFWLSQPATRQPGTQHGQPGGKLARLRETYHLSQTEIGQIDPSTETMRLATLGMRGIAGAILWEKANNYQMKKDWTNLRATLEQISKLQPHSIGVWRFQAWNLSYNVAASFDDYRDKYYWVIEGIKFLLQGAEANPHESRLLWDVGWFISHKIGRADEAKPYRRLFVRDNDFHGSRPPELRDNWLVGKEWFRNAEELVTPDHPVRGMAELIFFSNAPMCQFYYGDALEKEGRFEEVARRAWIQAGADWKEYGDRTFPTSYEMPIRLNDQEACDAIVRRDAAAIDKIEPGLREKIAQEKRKRLTAEEHKALDTPPEKRSKTQLRLAEEAEQRLVVTHEEVARRVQGIEPRRKALKLAEEAKYQQEMANVIRRERSKVNFNYWRTRAEMEQTNEALATRVTCWKADQADATGDVNSAKALYEECFKGWRILLDRYPDLKEDVTTGEEIADMVKRYQKVLKQLDLKFPDHFDLQDIFDKYKNR
jgi:hypothetical protein